MAGDEATTSDAATVHERVALLRHDTWQMSYGERAALEGIVNQLRPRLAVEIGTAEGGSLACIAPLCEEVHSFDLLPPTMDLESYPNVSLHTGDSHELLPQALASFADDGRRVDFALVDGDHTAAGVRADVEALLGSPAVAQALILIHDTANGVVREGLEAVDWGAYPRVRYVDLDFIGGYVFRKRPFAGEMWGGLGLVIVDDRVTAYVDGTSPRQDARYPAFDLLVDGWRAYAEREGRLAQVGGLAAPGDRNLAELERMLNASQTELAEARELLDAVSRSPSWRVTAPLRRVKARLRRS